MQSSDTWLGTDDNRLSKCFVVVTIAVVPFFIVEATWGLWDWGLCIIGLPLPSITVLLHMYINRGFWQQMYKHNRSKVWLRGSVQPEAVEESSKERK